MAQFKHLPDVEEKDRRAALFEGMSFRRYDFWRWHGLSPEMAILLACSDFETPDIYSQKNEADNSNRGSFTKIIGLGDAL